MDYDAIIIGEGFDAAASAQTAAAADLDVLLIERPDETTCPSKMASASTSIGLVHDRTQQIYMALHALGEPRLPSSVRAHFGEIYARHRQRVLDERRRALRNELERLNVSMVKGEVRFLSPTCVELESGDHRRAPKFVIAVGCEPRRPARFPFDNVIVCDPEALLKTQSVPNTLLVLGADILGCELGCLYATLGSSVTVVDRRTRLLRYVDADLREILHASMQDLGITVVLGEEVKDLTSEGRNRNPTHARLTLESGRIEVCDRVVIAAGNAAGGGQLALEKAGVATDTRGFILIDDRCRTSQEGIYAIGACVDELTPPGTSIQQGRIAIEDALGGQPEVVSDSPLIIHSVPEIATVGLTEEMCQCLDIEYGVTSAPWHGLDPERNQSRIKLLFDGLTQRVLGVHIIGVGAREIIELGARLVARPHTLAEVASLTFSVGSFSEAYRLAAIAGIARLARSEQKM